MVNLDVEVTPGTQQTAERLKEAQAWFEQEHPEIVEALRVMNISFDRYLRTLAALQEPGSTSGNAVDGYRDESKADQDHTGWDAYVS